MALNEPTLIIADEVEFNDSHIDRPWWAMKPDAPAKVRVRREPTLVWDSQAQGTAVRMSLRQTSPTVYAHDPMVPVYPTNRATRRRERRAKLRWMRKHSHAIQSARLKSNLG